MDISPLSQKPHQLHQILINVLICDLLFQPYSMINTRIYHVDYFTILVGVLVSVIDESPESDFDAGVGLSKNQTFLSSFFVFDNFRLKKSVVVINELETVFSLIKRIFDRFKRQIDHHSLREENGVYGVEIFSHRSHEEGAYWEEDQSLARTEIYEYVGNLGVYLAKIGPDLVVDGEDGVQVVEPVSEFEGGSLGGVEGFEVLLEIWFFWFGGKYPFQSSLKGVTRYFLFLFLYSGGIGVVNKFFPEKSIGVD